MMIMMMMMVVVVYASTIAYDTAYECKLIVTV